MISSVVLAAGLSSRFRSNKLLMPLGKTTVLNETVNTVLPFSDRVIIVTGNLSEEIGKSVYQHEKTIFVHNHEYLQGMFSSLRTGVRSAGNADKIIIIPGDIPFVKQETLEKLLLVDADFVVPEFLGRKGHPIIITKKISQFITDADAKTNLREIRDYCGFVTVEVNDENILEDIDTQEDYKKLTQSSLK